ncbi:MAG: hypothetical protein HUJ58_02105 [Erysipelotrichaceae bacterium]|nr:hypothetical protein [Erysipelotrichaceae bacterium]
MEVKTRAQRYQQKRENIATESEYIKPGVTALPSRAEARRVAQVQKPASNRELLSRMAKDNEAIDSLIQNNEDFMKEFPWETPKTEPKEAPKETLRQPESYAPNVSIFDVFDMDDGLGEIPTVSEVIAEGKTEETEPDFDIDAYEEELTKETSLLDEAISEVKTYNIQAGKRLESDTTANVFSELEKGRTDFDFVGSFDDILNMPAEENVDLSQIGEILDLFAQDTTQKPEEFEPVDVMKQPMPEVAPLSEELPVIDEVALEPENEPAFELPVWEEPVTEPKINIPALEEPEVAPVMPALEESEAVLPKEEEKIPAIMDDDMNSPFFEEEPEEPVMEEPVQPEPVRPQPKVVTPFVQPSVNENDEVIQELTQRLDRERIFREEMLQETRQLKMDMEKYESDLTDFDQRVNRTNHVLNFILILLIIALFCVLAFIAYWALVDRGIIPPMNLIPNQILHMMGEVL